MHCGIYKITNKILNKSYIGKSIHIEQRWKEHSQGKGSRELYTDIQKYGIENFNFEILELCSKNELNQKEEYWIKVFNTFHNGYNRNQGGDNNEQAVAKTKKKIFCYSLQGIFICSYSSLSEAERMTKVPNSNISRAAKKQGKAGDYLWSYTNEISLPPYQRTCNFKEKPAHNIKKVQQFDLNQNFIAEFNSIKEAAQATGTNYSSLGMVCNGKRRTAGGFIWRFKNGS